MKRFALALAALAGSSAVSALNARTSPEDLSVYILLDRTGSMSSIWDEALNSVNAYAEELAKDEADETALDIDVSLAVFDAQDGLEFDMLRRNADPEAWRPLTSDEASPRGMTPLFDAIGAMLTVAEADRPERAVLVVMTDGEENSSRELTKDNVRERLDRARKKGWEVVFLGAEFANFADASAVGVSAQKSMGVSKDGMAETMRRLSGKTKEYGKAAEPAAAPIEFDAEDRAVAGEDEVKDKDPL